MKRFRGLATKSKILTLLFVVVIAAVGTVAANEYFNSVHRPPAETTSSLPEITVWPEQESKFFRTADEQDNTNNLDSLESGQNQSNQSSQNSLNTSRNEPPPVDNSALIAACQATKQSYIDSKQTYINQIEAQHQSRLSAINNDYISRRLGNSGMHQSAINNENTYYQQLLAEFEIAYRTKISSYDC